jgi:hypothetical protein
MIRSNILLWVIVAALFFAACQKEEISTHSGAKLTFSADTISFDTVFSTIGTVTKLFTVKNPEKGKVNISGIYLSGGHNSNFRLNINGTPGNESRDVTISGGDSLFVFVEATIDPTHQNNPMVIRDSIVFQVNGSQQHVQLVAFGQDFHLINGARLKSQRWTNDKPYLVYNSVMIDPAETLTVDAGCRVHFHKGSSMFVLGTLIVDGTVDEPVYFQGDRLEKVYENVLGQWGAWRDFSDGRQYIYGGIHFAVGSKDNRIDYAVIKNAHKGIQTDSIGASSSPMLVISNTVIENMSSFCLNAHGSNVRAYNCIFANSGYYCLTLLYGGDYEFSHCTMANYFSFGTRKTPSLIISNYAESGGATYNFDLVRAEFNNCILYGSNANEVFIDKGGNGLFDYRFTNCLIKTDNPSYPLQPGFVDCLFNKDPAFAEAGRIKYGIGQNSPARNVANTEISLRYPHDILNTSRFTDEGPDIGAVEWVPEKE